MVLCWYGGMATIFLSVISSVQLGKSGWFYLRLGANTDIGPIQLAGIFKITQGKNVPLMGRSGRLGDNSFMSSNHPTRNDRVWKFVARPRNLRSPQGYNAPNAGDIQKNWLFSVIHEGVEMEKIPLQYVGMPKTLEEQVL